VSEGILARKNGSHHVVIEFFVKEWLSPLVVLNLKLKRRKRNRLDLALKAYNGKRVESVKPGRYSGKRVERVKTAHVGLENKI